MTKFSKIIALITAIYFISPSPSWGESVTRKASGDGVSRQEAINQALLSAVEQATGVLIRSDSKSARDLTSKTKAEGDDTQSSLDMSEKNQANLLKATGGYVKSYTIDSVTTENKVYTANVTAEIMVKNDAAPSLSRRTMVVGDFNPQNLRYFDDFVPFFAQSLASALTQSRRFAVLERGSDKTLDAEIALMDDPNVSMADWLKTHQKILADYIVTGQVLGYKADPKQSKIAVTGETSNWVDAQAQINYRVLAVATRQVKFAGTINCSQKFSDNGSGSMPSVAEANLLMAKALATSIAAQITQDIYPYRVIKADSRDNLVINQGGGALKVGEELVLVELGDVVEDPDTHEKLQTEREIGRVKIKRVTAKLSTAAIIDGVENNQMGDAILRRANETDACAVQNGTGDNASAAYGTGANGQTRPVIKLPGD